MAVKFSVANSNIPRMLSKQKRTQCYHELTNFAVTLIMMSWVRRASLNCCKEPLNNCFAKKNMRAKEIIKYEGKYALKQFLVKKNDFYVSREKKKAHKRTKFDF